MNCFEKYCSICGKEKKGVFIDIIGKYTYSPCSCEIKQQLEENNKILNRNKTALIENYKQKSGVVGIYENCSLQNFKATTQNQKTVIDKCLGFCKNPKGNLLIVGGVGTGKTHLCCGIINEITRDFVSKLSDDEILNSNGGLNLPTVPYCFLISETEMIKCFREYFKFDSNGKSKEILRICKLRKLLIIDDLGVRTGYTENDLSMLYEIIDYRYIHSLPTVITSNMTPKEISAIIGDRCYDRLKNCGEVISIKGNSHRKAKGQ